MYPIDWKARSIPQVQTTEVESLRVVCGYIQQYPGKSCNCTRPCQQHGERERDQDLLSSISTYPGFIHWRKQQPRCWNMIKCTTSSSFKTDGCLILINGHNNYFFFFFFILKPNIGIKVLNYLNILYILLGASWHIWTLVEVSGSNCFMGEMICRISNF